MSLASWWAKRVVAGTCDGNVDSGERDFREKRLVQWGDSNVFSCRLMCLWKWENHEWTRIHTDGKAGFWEP
jgi:hypothetical protein